MIGDNDKIVCRCMNVTMKDLKDVIGRGARSFEEVQTITKLGTGCGKCGESIKVLLNELLESK